MNAIEMQVTVENAQAYAKDKMAAYANMGFWAHGLRGCTTWIDVLVYPDKLVAYGNPERISMRQMAAQVAGRFPMNLIKERDNDAMTLTAERFDFDQIDE